LLGNVVWSANRLLYWLGTCENFIPNSNGALLCSFHLFAQHFSAINSLQECSWLFEELKGSAAFAGLVAGRHLCTLTHTLFLACTSWIRLLYWLDTCVNFILNSEGSLALFLLVVCPTLFSNQQSAGRSAVNCLKSWRAVLLLQDWWWEGTFTCTLLPSDIGIVFCTILNNMTMKDYFSMLKSSVMPQCPAGLLIKGTAKHKHWEDWTLSS
jgi:hypothetical protein